MNKYVNFYSKNKIIQIVCCKNSMSIEEEKMETMNSLNKCKCLFDVQMVMRNYPM